jgi:hypothetical protein
MTHPLSFRWSAQITNEEDGPGALCVTPPAADAMFGNLSRVGEMQCRSRKMHDLQRVQLKVIRRVLVDRPDHDSRDAVIIGVVHLDCKRGSVVEADPLVAVPSD